MLAVTCGALGTSSGAWSGQSLDVLETGLMELPRRVGRGDLSVKHIHSICQLLGAGEDIFAGCNSEGHAIRRSSLPPHADFCCFWGFGVRLLLVFLPH